VRESKIGGVLSCTSEVSATEPATQVSSEDENFTVKPGRKAGRFVVTTKKGAKSHLTASGHVTDVDFNGISMSRVDKKK